MTLETEGAALVRANAGSLPIATLSALGPGPAVPHPICTIFFVYMRFNRDGAFVANQYFYEGTAGVSIDPALDIAKPNCLGWFIKDMALSSRPSGPHNPLYKPLQDRLSGIQFPSHYSYCVFFMDDLHWKYLERYPGVPTINFQSAKDGQTYDFHPYAFVDPVLMNVEMPIYHSSDSDMRQAAVMTNTMHNKYNKELADKEKESFCFDLRMRVHYAGSTDGVTLVIDPTGDNMGPPGAP